MRKSQLLRKSLNIWDFVLYGILQQFLPRRSLAGMDRKSGGYPEGTSPDEGFDLNILINFAEKTKRVFHQYNPNTTLLICTHNPIVYLNYDVHMVSLSHITIVPGDLYFNTVTGWNMTLEKCESSK